MTKKHHDFVFHEFKNEIITHDFIIAINKQTSISQTIQSKTHVVQNRVHFFDLNIFDFLFDDESFVEYIERKIKK